MYTEEFFEVYRAYEMAVHKKERTPSTVKTFLCNSPVYDPEMEEPIKYEHAVYTTTKLDKCFREFEDEGVFPPCQGTYHMYHRIDGVLVAIGVIDILKTFLNSCYFIQHPDYMFLHMGVVGAIREVEYMRMIRNDHNPDLRYYQLGEMVPNCPKVNYKLHY